MGRGPQSYIAPDPSFSETRPAVPTLPWSKAITLYHATNMVLPRDKSRLLSQVINTPRPLHPRVDQRSWLNRKFGLDEMHQERRYP
jgi:hypothetical protein